MMAIEMRILCCHKKNGHYIAEAKRSTITVALHMWVVVQATLVFADSTFIGTRVFCQN
ncbi:MAG: hypothetical protein M3114_07795 [Thermoproteota archaeon]|nr:hypothetical protein [Thermoproteota archaeon]